MIAIKCISNTGGVKKVEFWAYMDNSMSILSPFKPNKKEYACVEIIEHRGKKINSNKVYQWFLHEKYKTESFEDFIQTITDY